MTLTHDTKRYDNVTLTLEQQDYVIDIIRILERELLETKRDYSQSNVDTAINMVKGKPPGDPT
jgi:hypothetical protein